MIVSEACTIKTLGWSLVTIVSKACTLKILWWSYVTLVSEAYSIKILSKWSLYNKNIRTI